MPAAQHGDVPQWWIGNAAEDGRAATVFARLRVPSADGSGAMDDHGVHAFIVPLRDESGDCLTGVEIRDCGYKVGCCIPSEAMREQVVLSPHTFTSSTSLGILPHSGQHFLTMTQVTAILRVLFADTL